jgi:hypothetical protein
MRDIIDARHATSVDEQSVVGRHASRSSAASAVLAVGGLTEAALSDEVAQNHEACRFADSEKARGLSQVEREAWHFGKRAKDQCSEM